MSDEKDGRTSVLKTLTASVMAEKKAAARTLTPVDGETPPQRDVLPRTKATFPNDIPQEVIGQKVDELDRIIVHLTEARDALATLVERPARNDNEPVDLDAVRKEKEAEADAKATEPNFNADFKAKQAAAQAQAFATPEAADEAVLEANADEFGWACPTHGKATTKTSSKTGREYIGCPDCNLFKR